MPYCPECGTDVDEGQRYCQQCGKPVGDTTAKNIGADGTEEPRDHPQGEVPSTPPTTTHSEPTTGTPAENQTRTAGDGDEGILFYAIGYPSRSGFGPPLTGGILLLFFFLIVPIFLVAGYFVRIAGAAATGEPKPPTFSEWQGMLKDGVVLFLVFLPLMIIYLPLIALAIDIHVGLYILFLLLGSYLFPAVFVNYAAEGEWKAAYDVSAIATLLSSPTYLLGAALYIFIINGIGFIIVMFLLLASLLTIVGWIILWPMIYFYWYAIDASLWGRVYYKVHHG